MKIFDATLNILDDIVSIENESFSVPWTRNNFVSALAVDNTFLYVLESDDGKIAGFCCLLLIDYESEILNIAVSPKYRNKGYGAELLNHMISKCSESNIESVFLEVRDSNVAARNLYGKFGFEIIGKRKNYYTLPTEDAILMQKTL